MFSRLLYSHSFCVLHLSNHPVNRIIHFWKKQRHHLRKKEGAYKIVALKHNQHCKTTKDMVSGRRKGICALNHRLPFIKSFRVAENCRNLSSSQCSAFAIFILISFLMETDRCGENVEEKQTCHFYDKCATIDDSIFMIIPN